MAAIICKAKMQRGERSTRKRGLAGKRWVIALAREPVRGLRETIKRMPPSMAMARKSISRAGMASGGGRKLLQGPLPKRREGTRF